MNTTEKTEMNIGPVKRRMEMLLQRIEKVFLQLHEVIDFFQPAVLEAVCNLATEHDNPKKRKYVFGLGSITCKREKTKVTIFFPKNYQIPSAANIAAFRSALNGLSAKRAA